MLAGLTLVLSLLSLPPHGSKAYFEGLDRKLVPRAEISREGGPVILIVVDALRPDRMSPYGFDRNTTPNLNALADDGLLFTNYFVNGNWTRPSTASLLTGLLPGVHGVERDRDRLAEQYETLAEVLEKAGIKTGAVVGNGNASGTFGMQQGFSFFADTRKHWDGLPSAEDVVALAEPFVQEHRDEDFFLMLFFVDPHDPYHAPGDYEGMFAGDTSVPLVRSPHWERYRYSEAQIARMKDTYDGAVRYTDDVLGQFFFSLKAMGVYDKATIMVTSDHGEAFGEHGVFLHSHHFYDEIIRAPLIVRSPKMTRRGGYVPYLFQSIDLLPTIAGLYGTKASEQTAGLDIIEHLRYPKRNDPNRTVICEFKNFGINRWMIRSYTHKMIYEEPADAKTFSATVGDRSLLPTVSFDQVRHQLYRLERDPFEKKDLYNSAALKRPHWRRLVNILTKHRKSSRSGTGVTMVKRLDSETESDLRALGYIQ